MTSTYHAFFTSSGADATGTMTTGILSAQLTQKWTASVFRFTDDNEN